MGTQKAKIAFEAVKEQKTVNEITQEYGVHHTQIRLWKKVLLENASQLFEVKRSNSEHSLKIIGIPYVLYFGRKIPSPFIIRSYSSI